MKTKQIQSIIEHAIDKIHELDCCDYAADLHNYTFNKNYFIIGTHAAKEWLGDSVFEAINCIKEYEQDNFGEVTTDLSDPERVVNMYAYIKGEELLCQSERLQEKWDHSLDLADLKKIADELDALTPWLVS